MQSSSLDLSLASELIISTKSLLTEYRTIAYWKKLYDYSVEVAKFHNITITSDPTTRRGRKRKRPSHLHESVILETVGSRNDPGTSEELKIHFYFPVLDGFISELGNRFNDKNLMIMKGVSACTPSSSIFLSLGELMSVADAYGLQTSALEVECRLLEILISQINDIVSLVDFGCYLVASPCTPNSL